MTKHVFGVYSSRPGVLTPPDPVPAADVRPVVVAHDGDATVAAYSVVHDRDGTQVRALLVCDLPDGSRAYATTSDAGVCAAAEVDEFVGTRVRLRSESVAGPLGPAVVNRVSPRAGRD